MSAPLLELRGGSVTFGRGPDATHAMVDVDLSLAPGEAVGVVGQSGSGKSTLVRALLGLVPLQRGEVTFEGMRIEPDVPAHWRRLRRAVQPVLQDASGALNPRLTARQALGEGLDLHHLYGGEKREGRLRELLALVGLGPDVLDRHPHQLSGGQRQRIVLARALAVEPRVLLCDEPVSALDLSVQAGVLNLLAELRARHGLTLLLVSHDLAVVRQVCDRVLVMYAGRVVEEVPAAQIVRDAKHPYTRALLAATAATEPSGPAREGSSMVQPASKTGCAWRPSCPDAIPTCSELPRLVQIGERQQVACWVHGVPSPAVTSGRAAPSAH